MSKTTIAHHKRPQRTSRHHRCNYLFLELLEEDFGISQFALRSAFMGVPPAPKKQAIVLCSWAIRAAEGDADKAGDLLRAWARKHEVGLYDRRLVDAPPLTWEQTEHKRSIGRH